MILQIYTLFHVVLSLIGVGTGFVVLFGLLTARQFDKWTSWFLVTTLATSITGFFFPFHGFLPSYVIGALSVVVLASAIAARYFFHLTRAWRPVYVVTAVVALYFNVFVLVVQLFKHVPSLRAAAPTQSEPPFLAAQLIVLALFVVLGILAVKRFRLEPIPSV
jgi:hypothetical protein